MKAVGKIIICIIIGTVALLFASGIYGELTRHFDRKHKISLSQNWLNLPVTDATHVAGTSNTKKVCRIKLRVSCPGDEQYALLKLYRANVVNDSDFSGDETTYHFVDANVSAVELEDPASHLRFFVSQGDIDAKYLLRVSDDPKSDVSFQKLLPSTWLTKMSEGGDLKYSVRGLKNNALVTVVGCAQTTGGKTFLRPFSSDGLVHGVVISASPINSDNDYDHWKERHTDDWTNLDF